MSAYSNKNPRLEGIAAKWAKVETLWNGTDSLKDAGKEFLPQEPKEPDENYAIRLQRSVFYNKYRSSVETSVGKLFVKPIVVSELPVELEDTLENIDAEGSTFNVFAKRIATDAMHFGIGYIVVDYPFAEEGSTLTDPSPYWVRIDPLSVTDVQVSFVDGIETLTRFAFTETIQCMSQSNLQTSYETKEQTKVLYLDNNNNPAFAVINNEDKVIAEGTITNGAGLPMSALPVVPVYGNKIEPFVGSPVLLDLAELNIAHWQDYSDIRNINHITSLPMLVLKGDTMSFESDGTAKQIVISPGSVIPIRDSAGDAKWIEHSGTSISTSLALLESLEDKMNVMGMEVMNSGSGSETATGRVIDAQAVHSKLKCIALDLENSLENALNFTSEYQGILQSDVEVIINTHFADAAIDSDMTNVLTLHDRGIVNKDTVLDEAKRKSIVSDETVIVPDALPIDNSDK